MNEHFCPACGEDCTCRPGASDLTQCAHQCADTEGITPPPQSPAGPPKEQEA